MAGTAPSHLVESLGHLASLFDEVREISMKKEVSFIHPLYRAMIEASPLAILATVGPQGLDTSPRGDPPGFVTVEDDHTLLLPERRGNNRIDSLKNILNDPKVSLLFLIPGVGETLRVRGRASISIAPDLLERFTVAGNPPKCVLIITVHSVFFQCSRAILRSHLWHNAEGHPASTVPSAGQILAAITKGEVDGEKYDRELPARQHDTLY